MNRFNLKDALLFTALLLVAMSPIIAFVAIGELFTLQRTGDVSHRFQLFAQKPYNIAWFFAVKLMGLWVVCGAFVRLQDNFSIIRKNNGEA